MSEVHYNTLNAIIYVSTINYYYYQRVDARKYRVKNQLHHNYFSKNFQFSEKISIHLFHFIRKFFKFSNKINCYIIIYNFSIYERNENFQKGILGRVYANFLLYIMIE